MGRLFGRDGMRGIAVTELTCELALQITVNQQSALSIKTPEELFPEYYLVRVNAFDKEASTPLEEWLDYLKNGRIRNDTTVPGLAEAREKLLFMMMSKTEQTSYLRHVDLMTSQKGAVKYYREEGMYEGVQKGRQEGEAKGRAEGKAEGRAEGLAEGEANAKLAMAKLLLEQGIDIEIIIKTTGLTAEEIMR